jgi:glycogen(starch) synthase
LNNNSPDICMLVCNNVTQDPRVRKEAESLAASGYSLMVLGFKFNEEEPEQEIFPTGFKVVRVNVAKAISLKNRIAGLSSVNNGRIRNKFVILAKLLIKAYQMVKFILMAAKYRAKVYHAHDLDALPAACLASFCFRGRLVYDSHELYTEQWDSFPGALKKILQYVERFLIRKADGVITVNKSIAGELSKRYQVPAPVILRNLMKRETSEVAVTSEAAAFSGEIKVLYHGGYLKGRGLEEVVKSVVYWEPNIKLYLRGFGPIEEDLREQVAGAGLSDRVIFLEPVPMVMLVAESAFADIGVMPYKPTCLNNYYSLPNKLFEYMMAGLAVVASDLPEIRALNGEVGFGLLFDPASPESIAAAVNELARDKTLLVKCREKARTWSITAGNWESESKKLLSFYGDFFSKEIRHTSEETNGARKL